jgi:aminopeptidase N
VTPADALAPRAYGDNAYGKPALGYLGLKDMLGDTMFRTALHAFMDRWHGKHPIPWDFFNTVNDVTGQNLNWYWNGWFFSNGNIDLAVNGVAKTGDGYNVVIDNVGGMPAPVDLQARYADGSSETIHETPSIWRANPRRATVPVATRKSLQSLVLDGGIWVDSDSTNNRWTQH